MTEWGVGIKEMRVSHLGEGDAQLETAYLDSRSSLGVQDVVRTFADSSSFPSWPSSNSSSHLSEDL